MSELKLSQQIAFEKLQRYCTYQERCHSEVRTKLISLKIYGDDLEEVITELIKADYLNEERFARAYARGKFRLKEWGKIKIKQHLWQKRVSEYCIRKSFEEIDEEEYYQTLRKIILKQIDLKPELNNYAKKDKAIKYAYGRGYESNLIFEIIKELENESLL